MSTQELNLRGMVRTVSRITLALVLALNCCWLFSGCQSGGSATGATGTGTGGFESGCIAGTRFCEGNSIVLCGSNGAELIPVKECTGGEVCNQGVCRTCEPETPFCQGGAVVTCTADGTVSMQEECPDACVAGMCVTCVPGIRECRQSLFGDWEAWVCLATGANTSDWSLVERCDADDDCSRGLCIGPCQDDVKIDTSQGCDYFAVELENGASAEGTPSNGRFAVMVYNPSNNHELNINVFEDATTTVAEQSVAVDPSSLQVLTLPNRQVSGSQVSTAAWKIRGDRPFAAYQFNPLDNVDPIFSNDASLLLPVNALGAEYRALTGTGGKPFLSVVASASDTSVSITPTWDIEVGELTLDTAPLPVWPRGETQTFQLEAGQVLTVQTVSDSDADLSGSYILADKNVSVFSGNVATTTGARCCADHLEQQLPPVAAWGTRYVGTRFEPRGAERDHWAVLAHTDETVITVTSNLFPTYTMSAGETFRFSTDADFVLESTKPVLLGQVMASSFEVLPLGDYCEGDGDCDSGVCSPSGPGGGRCAELCTAEQSSCASSEVCVDRRLIDDINGGSCRYRPCGAGLAVCGAETQCVDGDTLSVCLEPCDAVDFECASGASFCQFGPDGDYCVPSPCTSASDCGSGRCELLSAENGRCVDDCLPSSDCAPGYSCLPAGYAVVGNDRGICVAVDTCSDDTDCPEGTTCARQGDVRNCQPVGDPAFSLVVPTTQWRTSYTFLTPEGFASSYVNLAFPKSAKVSLDGQPVGPGLLVSTGEYRVTRIRIDAGAHTITSDLPVGTVVYGFGDDVSYAYPAGTNLIRLDDE